MSVAKCPTVTVKLTGTDGNIFALMGKVSRALRRNGYSEEAQQMKKEIMECSSYDEALGVLTKYVNVE